MRAYARRAGLVLVTVAAAGLLLSPATAANFLTRKKADKRYINVGEKASDADLLDGQDSTAFLSTNQKAADADKLDGKDSTQFQGAYARTIVVAPVGTPTQNGTALRNALNSITGASGANRYLLKIEPGNYDLGNTPLQMKSWVDIEGSGAPATDIWSGAFNTDTSATIMSDALAELRFLRVLNFGMGPYAIALRLTGPTQVSHISARAVGGTTETTAIDIPSGGPELFNVRIEAIGPDGAVSNGITSAGGPYMANGHVIATHGINATSVGVNVTDGAFFIDRSLIRGDTDAILRTGGDVRVGASRLMGGVSGTVICAGVYDGSFAFHASTCPA